MEPRVLRTEQAKADLLDIFLYIGQRNFSAAERHAALLDDKCRFLAEFPESGAKWEEVSGSVRRFSVGNYVIYYRPIDGGIEVLRVLHGARDLRKAFPTEEEKPQG